MAMGTVVPGSDSAAPMCGVSPRRDHTPSPCANLSPACPELSKASPLPSRVMAGALQSQLSAFQRSMVLQMSDFAMSHTVIFDFY